MSRDYSTVAFPINYFFFSLFCTTNSLCNFFLLLLFLLFIYNVDKCIFILKNRHERYRQWYYNRFFFFFFFLICCNELSISRAIMHTCVHWCIHIECYRGDLMTRINRYTYYISHCEKKRERDVPSHTIDTPIFSVSVSLRVRSIIIIVCTWFLMPRDLFIQRFKDVFGFFP